MSSPSQSQSTPGTPNNPIILDEEPGTLGNPIVLDDAETDTRAPGTENRPVVIEIEIDDEAEVEIEYEYSSADDDTEDTDAGTRDTSAETCTASPPEQDIAEELWFTAEKLRVYEKRRDDMRKTIDEVGAFPGVMEQLVYLEETIRKLQRKIAKLEARQGD
ncbi:hypothetical protein BJX61DRAFT_541026 [Aspergillus egyptiacus]|nr:hypothetical protein BJX61DRAFT_541026 [Aspergillus egyptiacus]